ncbi:EEED8.16, partial [Symbiodinium necroappetens]
MRLSSCSDTEVGDYLQLAFARLMVSLQEESESLSKQIKDAASAESLAHRQRSQLEEVNKRLSQEQRAFEDQQEDQAEQKRGERQQRDREISELQQEIKDLELFLQMRRRCEASADVNELQAAHLLVTEGENRRGRRNR